jgi:hypothetical protein
MSPQSDIAVFVTEALCCHAHDSVGGSGKPISQVSAGELLGAAPGGRCSPLTIRHGVVEKTCCPDQVGS